MNTLKLIFINKQDILINVRIPMQDQIVTDILKDYLLVIHSNGVLAAHEKQIHGKLFKTEALNQGRKLQVALRVLAYSIE